MRPDDFQPNAPGDLVPTEFVETRPGQASRTVPGIAFIPKPLPPALERHATIGRLYDVLERATINLQRLDGQIDALPSRTVLLSAMRVREAQASSRIENTFATIEEMAIAGDDQHRAPAQAQEVYRNRLAIERGLASELPVSGRLLKDMHKVLVTDPKHLPGSYRKHQVCIGEKHRGFEHARFVPPPHDRVEECMRDWELFANPGALNASPRDPWPYFIELALAHYQFETIHPFSDGNGRLGRAIVTLAPVKDGQLRHPVCNLSEWVQSHRDEYYDRLLRVSTHAEWEPWIRFFCTALAEQAAMDAARATRVSDLHQKYTRLITQRRGSALVTKLIDYLFGSQVIRIPRAAEIMGLSYTAAQRHIDALVRKKILTPVPGMKRDRFFVAWDIIRAIQGDDEPDPQPAPPPA